MTVPTNYNGGHNGWCLIYIGKTSNLDYNHDGRHCTYVVSKLTTNQSQARKQSNRTRFCLEESITEEEEDIFIKEEVTEPDDDDFIDGPDDVIEELRAVGGGGLPLLLPRPNKSSETDDDGKTTVTPLKYNKKKRNTGRKKLKEKMIEIEDDEEGRCDQCYKTFKNIKRHMLTHEAPQIFYCPKCDFNTPRKYTLIRHERTYKGHMKNGKCRRCQLRVPPHAEADHKCIILCNVCGKTFPTWKILTAHYQEVHGINMIKKAEGRKKIVRCGACKIKLNPGEEDDHRCVFWC